MDKEILETMLICCAVGFVIAYIWIKTLYVVGNEDRKRCEELELKLKDSELRHKANNDLVARNQKIKLLREKADEAILSELALQECKTSECIEILDKSDYRYQRGLLFYDKGYTKMDLLRIITALRDLVKDKAWLPSVVRWLDVIMEQQDTLLLTHMIKRSAKKSAEIVAELKRENRKLRSEVEIARNFVDAYEAIAPWLRESVDCTLDELLEAKKEEEKFRSKASQDEDPSRAFLSAEEYKALPEVARHQRALDRYWSHYVKRNLWLVGIQYERYIGYLYESKGYSVEYQGAVLGKDDLGIDLIARKGIQTHVIQCKRYSAIKKIPVRENSVAQIYGAAMAYKAIHKLKSVKAVLCTSYELSYEARVFADALNVAVRENLVFERYPCIKCNIAKDGERIYHLPFDQMYDRVKIDQEGELYANTIQEAHLNGFRRAYKWRGSS